LEAAFVVSSPIREVLVTTSTRCGCSHAVPQFVVEVTRTAITLVSVQPSVLIVHHVIGGISVVLALFITRSPVGVVQSSRGSGGVTSHALAHVIAVMLFATLYLGAEQVLTRVLGHVERLVTVTNAARAAALPIRIPVGTGAGVVVRAHAVIVVPREVLGTALIEGGEEPGGGVLVHPAGVGSVIEAARFPARSRLVRVEQIDGWRRRRG